jgi:hypothetical protein
MILFGEEALRNAVHEFVAHYHLVLRQKSVGNNIRGRQNTIE